MITNNNENEKLYKSLKKTHPRLATFISQDTELLDYCNENSSLQYDNLKDILRITRAFDITPKPIII